MPSSPLPLPPPPESKFGWPWAVESELPRVKSHGPKISIIIPSYNQGQYIEETLRSVLLQSYQNIELIIIDGGSTDCTLSVIRQYEPWIDFWVSEPDGGQAQAINKGFKRATGDWIAWINSDDYYQPGAFSQVISVIHGDPAVDVVCGNKDSFNADGSFRQSILACEPSYRTMLPWQCIYSESTFFRREEPLKDLFIDESFQHYMDFDLFWRLFLSGRRFQHLPQVLAKWRIHPASKSIRGKDRADIERFTVIWNVLNDPRTPKEERAWVLHHLTAECLNSFGKGHYPRFRNQVRQMARSVGLLGVSPRVWLRFLLSPLFVWKKISKIDPGLEDKNIPAYDPAQEAKP